LLAFQGRESSFSFDQVNPNTQPIVTFPPQFESIPCKPMVFDLAGNFVEYPSVSHRAKQKGGISGLLSSLWGS